MKIYKESRDSEFSSFISDLLQILEFKEKVEIHPRANGFEIVNRIGKVTKYSRVAIKYNSTSLYPRVMFFRATTNRYSKAYEIVMTFDKPAEDLDIDDAKKLANKMKEFSGTRSVLK